MENQIEIYQSTTGQTEIAVKFEKDVDTIGLHLRNIFKEGELEESSTTEDFSVVQTEGKRSFLLAIGSIRNKEPNSANGLPNA